MAANTYNPQAQYSYVGGLGGAPAPVPMPQPALDLAQQIPGLTNLNTKAGGVLGSELAGQLSPDTQAAIQNASATQSVAGGMPGTNVIAGTLGGNRTLRDIGTTSQQLQTQGLADYSKFVPTVSGTQTVAPALQAEINTQNAVSAAAPSPAAQVSYAQSLFQNYLNQMNQPVMASKPKTQAEQAGFPNNGEFVTYAGQRGYSPLPFGFGL